MALNTKQTNKENYIKYTQKLPEYFLKRLESSRTYVQRSKQGHKYIYILVGPKKVTYWVKIMM